jgi:putative Mg2+ transporter-C (MgtC) family protein
MTTTLTWQEIALRLFLTVLAAGAIGFNRDERGHSAGLRTNLLVSLAACIAMIETNLLIDSAGKPGNSFVVMDIMRLPLGILDGIGFIGAGAIIKRGEMTVGVTTAATLWFVTVMGLCFGGGQIGLGLVSFALGFAILTGLKELEREMPRQQSGLLKVNVSAEGPDQDEIEALLKDAGISLQSLSLSYNRWPASGKEFGWKVQWQGRGQQVSPPPVIERLSKHPDVRELEFTR